MKLSIKSFFYVALASVVCLSSCSSEDETPAPSIRLVSPPSEKVVTGQEVEFAIEATAPEKIEKIVITEKIGSESKSILTKTKDFTSNTDDFFKHVYTVESTSGTIELTFTITDRQGKEAGTSYKLTVEEDAVLMTFEQTGAIIANKIGPSNSMWDLATNVSKEAGSSDADMANPSTTDNLWVKGWDGVRKTTFVKTTDLNFAEVTAEAAEAAFADGTASEKIRDVAVDDIYVAKIKGESDYAVIKITHADDDLTGNGEKIEFTYKKVSEKAGQ